MARRNKNKKNWLLLVFLVFVAGVLFLLARKLAGVVKNSWSGSEQISLAVEAENKDSLILTLTPGKEMVVVTRIPSKTMIETPWFGYYQVGKLPLLTEQEGSLEIYNRSLSYYLGVAVDASLMDSGFNFNKENKNKLKNKLTKLFFLPRSLTFGRVWRFLSRKDLVWEVIDLEDFGQEDYLADGSAVFNINPESIDQKFWGYFSDPVINKENLTLSIFNVGDQSGLAQKISFIAENMGVRVVEISDMEVEVNDCLIAVSNEEAVQSRTVQRLHRVFGCPIETNQLKGIGEIKLLIENVKID